VENLSLNNDETLPNFGLDCSDQQEGSFLIRSISFVKTIPELTNKKK
jgi:hypothetical protein